MTCCCHRRNYIIWCGITKGLVSSTYFAIMFLMQYAFYLGGQIYIKFAKWPIFFLVPYFNSYVTAS